jgi:low affinity Fe/Cu permease
VCHAAQVNDEKEYQRLERSPPGRQEMGRDEAAGKQRATDRDVTTVAATRGPSRSAASRLLSRADRYASRPSAVVVVVAAAGTWLVISVVAGFPAHWETIFETVVAAVTLAMVFVIQHSQVRHQRASQRKLDEILLALPGTDSALVTLEHASDDELHAAGHQHLSLRQAALQDEAVPDRPA